MRDGDRRGGQPVISADEDVRVAGADVATSLEAVEATRARVMSLSKCRAAFLSPGRPTRLATWVSRAASFAASAPTCGPRIAASIS